MAERVKPTRSYHSPRRSEQAAATRREILEAARRLFERQGYAPTTMAAIAAEAGVALKTVYVAFETKSGVLRALWHLLLRGDEADVPVGDRDWYRAVLEEADAEQQLRMNAHQSRLVKERAGALMYVIRSAASTDPDTADLWERIQTEFHGVQRRIVQAFESRHGLPVGLDFERAADIVWTLNHPDVWQLLVRQRGWAPEDWEQWFGDAVCAQLLQQPEREA